MRVLVSLALALAVALGQSVEATVFLPESLCGIGEINRLVWNPANNRVYAASGHAGHVMALSAGSGKKTARIAAGDFLGELCVNPALDRVYAYDECCRSLAVIDGSGDTVMKQVHVPFSGRYSAYLAYSRVSSKLYCLSTTAQLAVLDATSDSVTKCHYLHRWDSGGLLYSAAANKLYVPVTYPWYHDICIVDGTTDTTIVTISADIDGFTDMVANDSSNKVYFLCYPHIQVMSGTVDAIHATIGFPGQPAAICCNPVTNRIYAAYEWIEGPYEPRVAVIDGAADTVVATIPLSSAPGAVVCSPVSNRVYVGLDDGSVAVIDGVTNQVVAIIQPGPAPHVYVACHDATDDVVFTSIAGAGLVKIDCQTDSVVHVEDLGCEPGVIAYAREQDKLFVFDRHDGVLLALDGTTNEVRRSFSLPLGPFIISASSDLAYNPDLGRMYVPLGDSGLAVIDCASESLRRIVDLPATAVVYDSVRRKVYCAGSASLWVLDAEAETLLAEMPSLAGVCAMGLNPERGWLYAGSMFGPYGVTVIDCAGDSVFRVLETGSAHTRFVWCQPYDKIYAVSDNLGELLVIDCATNQVLEFSRPGGHPISGVALNVDGTRLYCPAWQSEPSLVIDCATDSVLAELDTLRPSWEAWSRAAVWSHDNERIYVPAWNQGVLTVRATPGHRTDSILTGTFPMDVLLHPTADRVYVANERSSSLTIISDEVGVDERPRLNAAARGLPMPTVVRGVLVLGGVGSRQNTAYRAELVDVSGRKVLELHAGANDVSRLSPGVYFVREAQAQAQAQAVGGQPSAVIKILIAR